ncbi:MAG: response regulator [Candidatus Omnitrophota bacterium]|nr:MAG: response regulator [Candidatus Omnitrophota bacterium]
MLAFSRKQIMQPRIFNLNTLLADDEKMLQRMIGEDITLRIRFADSLGFVKADPGQIEQVIMNLVVNARDAMPQGGQLTIETTTVHLDGEQTQQHGDLEAGVYVLLRVIDTGCGMDAEIRKQIFDPFFTTKEQGKGTGLGLSTVYGIVRQSGGSIEVASEPGHGTTFEIYLPRIEAESVRREEKLEKATLRAASETVLVVEDDETILNGVIRMLEDLGYTVLSANTPSEAIRLVNEYSNDIHVVITDVVMPEMNGKDLSEHLGSIKPTMKFLFMSGYTADIIAKRGVLEEGMHFIPKPFAEDALAAKLREMLDK